MGGKVSTHNSLGQGCSSIEIDEQIMDTAGLQVYETLVRLRDLGVSLKWDNSEILHWYSTKGVALKSKSKFRDLPAAIVYLLRRNDLKRIAEGERTLENIQSLERLRSEEIKRLGLLFRLVQSYHLLPQPLSLLHKHLQYQHNTKL